MIVMLPQYWYEAEEPEKTVSVELMRNGRYLIDDNYGTTG